MPGICQAGPLRDNLHLQSRSDLGLNHKCYYRFIVTLLAVIQVVTIGTSADFWRLVPRTITWNSYRLVTFKRETVL